MLSDEGHEPIKNIKSKIVGGTISRFSQPDDQLPCIGVDLSHKKYLLGLFLVVVLINAYSVNPYDTRLSISTKA